MQDIEFSVVIATKHRPNDLTHCLEALAKQRGNISFEVIVVDNSSGDPETRAVAERYHAVYVTENEGGLCRARNRGALESKGSIVGYLDDDSVPDPDWISAYRAAFTEHPEIAAASGRTLPSRVETDSEKLFASIRGGAYDRPLMEIVGPDHPEWFELTAFGGIGPGCNMAFRRSAFARWRGFNEKLGRGTPIHGGDEHHAFFSLVALGFSVAYVPGAVVHHPLPPTMSDLYRRYSGDVSATTAYLSLLLAEESGHRMKTLRYMMSGLRGTPRKWRNQSANRPRLLSRAQKVAAMIEGPLMYLRGRIRKSPAPLDLRAARR
jgi:glycosyltransferase involved in cell wall biosynthesis